MRRLKSKTDHSIFNGTSRQRKTNSQRGGRSHQRWVTGRWNHQSCDTNGGKGKQRENSERPREADTSQTATLFVLAQKPLKTKSVSKLVHLDFAHVTYLQDTYPGIKRLDGLNTALLLDGSTPGITRGLHDSIHPCTTPPTKPPPTGARTHTHTQTKAAPKPGAQLNKSRPRQQPSWNRTSTNNQSSDPE